MKIFPIAMTATTVLVGLTTILGSWYTIDQGERGVVLRNGAITGTAQPGLGFKIPLVDDVEKISVQSKSRLYENVQSYSRDQQPASITISVSYRLPADQVTTIYERFGGEDGLVTRLIDRRVFEQVKNVFGRFNAVTAIQERARLNLETAQAITDAVQGPVIIESVQIENIDFSDAYEASIEARMLAEVEVQKLQQNAEREKVQAEITVTQADAQAQAVIKAATAEAQRIEAVGQAEASAIRAKGEALRDNPALVELISAERWNGVLPTTMVPSGATPFVSVK